MNNIVFQGIPLKTLNKLMDNKADLGPLKSTDNHRVVFKQPVSC